MDSLSFCETSGSVRRSSMVAPTKLLRCFSILHAISNVGLLELSCSASEIVVTGLNLPQLYYEYSSINDDPHAHIHKEISNCLQHPDYSYRTNRRKSFKHWDGLFPPRELVEAGFYMVARNQVRCFSCNVLVHVLDWKRGDDVVDKHYQRSPNCGFVKELLNGVVSGIPNHHSCSEKPLIKVRVKKEGSSVNTSSIINKTEHPSSIMPNNVCKDHPFITGIHHQPSQQSISTDGYLPKSSTKSTDPIMYSSPREQIVLVSCIVESFLELF